MKFIVKSCEQVFESFMVKVDEGHYKRMMVYGYKSVLKQNLNQDDIFESEYFVVTFDHPITVGSEIEL